MTTIINVSTSGIVESVDTSGSLQVQTSNSAAITIDSSQNVTLNSTGAVTLNSGTTAQRPSSATNGMIRYNTDFNGLVEGYSNGAWVALTGTYNYTASYALVAGAGGGAAPDTNESTAGAGGAGGLLIGTASLAPGVTYTFTLGSGGAGGRC